MAIAVSGVTVELREVVLRDKPPQLIEASGKATVPVLVLPDGSVIDESLDIMRWVLVQNDPEAWLATEDTELIQQNDSSFKAALDRYKYPHRYGLGSGTSHRDDGLAILAQLDERLSDQLFLNGPARGITDIATFPFVRQFAATDQIWFDTQPLPGLHRWLRRHLESDLFARVMLRPLRWHAEDPVTLFP